MEDIRGEELGDEIATLSAQLQVATYHLLVLLREFDEIGGWALPGLNHPWNHPMSRLRTSSSTVRKASRVGGGAPISIEYLLDTTWRPRISPE